ncbi:Unknown protein sequence [Pseudomonas amygdali pv. morsprunorum]|nr:Unknown protein sequence [Pseudomonas amygdali pv. morsprunorum]
MYPPLDFSASISIFTGARDLNGIAPSLEYVVAKENLV